MKICARVIKKKKTNRRKPQIYPYAGLEYYVYDRAQRIINIFKSNKLRSDSPVVRGVVDTRTDVCLTGKFYEHRKTVREIP